MLILVLEKSLKLFWAVVSTCKVLLLLLLFVVVCCYCGRPKLPSQVFQQTPGCVVVAVVAVVVVAVVVVVFVVFVVLIVVVLIVVVVGKSVLDWRS